MLVIYDLAIFGLDGIVSPVVNDLKYLASKEICLPLSRARVLLRKLGKSDSMVDWSACAFFSTGRTLVSTNFAAFTVSLAAVARACSILEINALMFFCFLAR